MWGFFIALISAQAQNWPALKTVNVIGQRMTPDNQVVRFAQ
jgi:hypothetical protein